MHFHNQSKIHSKNSSIVIYSHSHLQGKLRFREVTIHVEPKKQSFLSAWHSQTYGIPLRLEVNLLVPCLVDRTFFGHESQLILRMRAAWCYLLPYLTLHAIDTSHRIWQNHKEIWLVAELVRFWKEIKTKSSNFRLEMKLYHRTLTLTARSFYATVT